MQPRLLRIRLNNFLSYRSAVLELGDFVALVGPNASGKSNAVAAIKLLREIPFHGLPLAIAKRGGFDQLRYRSAGHPYDPSIRLDFKFGDSQESFYELKLGSIGGKRYEVKSEQGELYQSDQHFSFENKNGVVTWVERDQKELHRYRVPPGQSVVTLSPVFGAYLVSEVLQSLQTVEINPSRIGDLQEPSSTREFEPDGSNTASIYDTLSSSYRKDLIDQISAIVPGIDRIDVRRLADKVTLSFYQKVETKGPRREFLAKQMSDGTLRAFGILLSMTTRPSLLVIEEPEIAIHLGALQTLVDILQQQSKYSQVLITTHSADIVDMLPPESLRVVWSDKGSSQISKVAEHTLDTVRKGLITSGELLRSDALDPAGQ